MFRLRRLWLVVAVIPTLAMARVEWVARYNGPDNGWDQPVAMAVDRAGNVYVTGRSGGPGCATVKYDSTGVEQWSVRYPRLVPNALALDRSGNVYIAGAVTIWGSDYDYLTIKYDPMGAEQWVAQYSFPYSGYAGVNGVVVDSLGNCYVTGGTVGLRENCATIKYDSAGVEQWSARYPRLAANAIALDRSGNVYIAGAATIVGSDYDYLTVKYDSNGLQQWAAYYNGPSNGEDIGTRIAVDASGNAYVTGRSAGLGTGPDWATVKYNSNGVKQWVARYDGPEHKEDMPCAMVLDSVGDVYVAGWSLGHRTYYDCPTIKYSPAGMERWAARYNGPGNSEDRGNSICLDDSGNAYVAGKSAYDYLLVAYAPNGVEQWVARYSGSGKRADVATSVGVDGTGAVYVTGWSWLEDSTGYDYLTLKYRRPECDVAVLSIDEPVGLVGPGTVRPKATVKNYGTSPVTFSVCCTSAGYRSTRTVTRLPRATAQQIVFDDWSVTGPHVYEMAAFAALEGDEEPANDTMRQSFTVLGIGEVPAALPGDYELRVAPVAPAAPPPVVCYAVPVRTWLSVVVYDVAGRPVRTLVEGNADAGPRTIRWDCTDGKGQRLSSGVYFLQLRSKGRILVRKAVMVR